MLSLGTLSLLIFVRDTENAAAYAQINTQQIYITFFCYQKVLLFATYGYSFLFLQNERLRPCIQNYIRKISQIISANIYYTSNNEIQKQPSFSLVFL